MRIFKEEQRFTQLWLVILIAVSMLIPVGIIISTYIKDPKSFTAIELFAIIGLLILSCGIIFLFKLHTRIDEKGILYKFFPFHWSFRLISWQDINKAYVRKYDALTEFGGWGFKGGNFWKKSKGRAINISGDIGIQLELKNGKKLLIGTQKQDEAKRILVTYKHKIEDEKH